jgi:hypothetical protein
VLAEPSNRMSFASTSTMTGVRSQPQVTEAFDFYCTCERGKVALGEGDNSIGDVLAGIVAAHDVDDLRVYLGDRAHPEVPPYDSPGELAERADEGRRDEEFYHWNRADTERYFVAGGGEPADFDARWQRCLDEVAQVRAARAAGTFFMSGAVVMYLVSARRPG